VLEVQAFSVLSVEDDGSRLVRNACKFIQDGRASRHKERHCLLVCSSIFKCITSTAICVLPQLAK